MNFSASRRVRVSRTSHTSLADGYTIVNDNNNLASRASSLLVRMCGVTPPVPLINPILEAIFDAIQKSPVSISNTAPKTMLLNGITTASHGE